MECVATVPPTLRNVSVTFDAVIQLGLKTRKKVSNVPFDPPSAKRHVFAWTADQVDVLPSANPAPLYIERSTT